MWLVTCEGKTLARWPRLFLLIASLTQKCLLLFPRVLVDSSHPEMDVATARNANFRTILARRLERGPHRSRLNEAHNLHLPLEHPGHGQEEAPTLHPETFATFIGIPVNATADSTAHSNTRRTRRQDLTSLTQQAEPMMTKTLRMQP